MSKFFSESSNDESKEFITSVFRAQGLLGVAHGNATDGEAVEAGVEDGCTMAAKPACLEMKFDDTEENDGTILVIDSCNDNDSTDEELVANTLITEV